jgi:hypothetical protein
MNSSRSAPVGQPVRMPFPRLANSAAGQPPQPDQLRALLLPMVSRALRTGRGPAGLLRWISRAGTPWPADDQLEQEERSLTDALVTRFVGP